MRRSWNLVWPLIIIFTALILVIFLISADEAKGHIIKCSPKITTHTCDHRNVHHASTALVWIGKSDIWGLKRRIIIKNHTWLKHRMAQKITAYHNRLKPAGISSAWAWYYTRDTQCVVNEEGAWNSPSNDPPGMYAGRFQMDEAFEKETTFGRTMSDRYGRAWNWPPWVQVYHAWTIWKYAGWSRWPTYAKYCA
jgi:hypothetical protein